MAPLSAPYPGLLLRAADEQHPLRLGELRQELLGQVVLALALGEGHQFQAARGDEPVDVGDKVLGHRVHQRRRDIVVATVAHEEARHATPVGQPRLPHVEVHPIDGLHLEDHVLVEDIGDTARYGHHGLRSTGGQQAHQPLRAVHTPDRQAAGTPVTV
jgi:hypothetical protein